MGLTDIPTTFGSSFFIRTFFPASIATALYSLAFYDILKNFFSPFNLGFGDIILIWILITFLLGMLMNMFDLYIYQLYEGIWGWPEFLKNFFYERQIRKVKKIDDIIKDKRQQISELKDQVDEIKLRFLGDELSQLFAEIRKFPYNPDSWYLFSWDEFSEDNGRFRAFLGRIFGLKWIRTAKIDKVGNTINIYSKNNSVWLRLNNEKTRVTLTIDNVETDEFIVKMEDGKLNIYYDSYMKRYPESPTEFGNVLAEYELYSEKQYGVHMIVFWQHLWLILPKELREDLDLRSAKADFNVYVSFILLTFAFIGSTMFAFQSNSWYKFFSWSIPKALIIAVISLFGCYIFYKLSISEHKAYGRYVKAVFDLYKSDLATKLKKNKSPEIEKELWVKRRRYFLDYRLLKE